MPTTKTVRTRKATATPPAERPAPAVDLTADAFDPDTVEKRFLCEIDGVEYYIAAQHPAGVLYEYIEIERSKGLDDAMWWGFAELVGEGFVEALRSYRGLTRAHLRQLQMVMIETLTGPKD
jgi:hypothetical protein